MKGEHQHTDAMGILFWSLLVLAVAIGYAVISAQGRSHRTITLQSLNYFSRPHDGEVRMDPIEGRAAWLGGALEPQDWMVTLTDQDAEDLDLEIQRFGQEWQEHRPAAQIRSAIFEQVHCQSRLLA